MVAAVELQKILYSGAIAFVDAAHKSGIARGFYRHSRLSVEALDIEMKVSVDLAGSECETSNRGVEATDVARTTNGRHSLSLPVQPDLPQ